MPRFPFAFAPTVLAERVTASLAVGPRFSILCLGLVGALLAACGGGDSPKATPTVAASVVTAQLSPDGHSIPLCVSLGNGAEAPKSKDFPASVNPAQNIPAEQRNKVNVIVAGLDFYVGGENNFVLGITNKKDEPQGGAKVRITFYDLKDAASPKPYCQGEALQSAPGVGKEVKHVHAAGETHIHGGQDDGRVGYYIRVKFEHVGAWGDRKSVV